MIILDTHIWVWWVQGDARLTKQHQNWLQQYESQGLGICIMSCWEVAKLVEIGKLPSIKLGCGVHWCKRWGVIVVKSTFLHSYLILGFA